VGRALARRLLAESLAVALTAGQHRLKLPRFPLQKRQI